MNMWDGLTHPDPKVRESHEIMKQAMEKMEVSVARPFYDSFSKLRNFKAWVRYNKQRVDLFFEKVLSGHKRVIKMGADHPLKTAVWVIGQSEPAKKTLNCVRCHDITKWPIGEVQKEDKPCDWHIAFDMLDKQLAILKAERMSERN